MSTSSSSPSSGSDPDLTQSVAGEEDPGASVEATPGMPGTGEDACPRCGGSGKLAAGTCPKCQGTGKATIVIGAA